MMVEVALSATEEAYLAMTLQDHANTTRQVDALRNGRIDVLLSDHGIRPGTPINTRGRIGDRPAVIIYDAPDISGTGPADPESVVSVKSTAPDAQG